MKNPSELELWTEGHLNSKNQGDPSREVAWLRDEPGGLLKQQVGPGMKHCKRRSRSFRRTLSSHWLTKQEEERSRTRLFSWRGKHLIADQDRTLPQREDIKCSTFCTYIELQVILTSMFQPERFLNLHRRFQKASHHHRKVAQVADKVLGNKAQVVDSWNLKVVFNAAGTLGTEGKSPWKVRAEEKSGSSRRRRYSNPSSNCRTLRSNESRVHGRVDNHWISSLH